MLQAAPRPRTAPTRSAPAYPDAATVRPDERRARPLTHAILIARSAIRNRAISLKTQCDSNF